MGAWAWVAAGGVLGGFTTFSAFSIDVVNLVQQDRVFEAVVYVVASIILSIGAAFAGMALIRAFG
jgi:CrcB protein